MTFVVVIRCHFFLTVSSFFFGGASFFRVEQSSQCMLHEPHFSSLLIRNDHTNDAFVLDNAITFIGLFFALHILHVRIYIYIYNKPKCCFSLIHKYIPLVDCICIIRIKFARYGTFFFCFRSFRACVWVFSQHFGALCEKSVICL